MAQTPIILDFGGVLYDIDYDAPVHAFDKLGCGSFAEIYHQSSQIPLFDLLETGKISENEFYHDLLSRCSKGTTLEEVHEAWCCILTGMPQHRADLVQALSRTRRVFLLSNTNAIHSKVFEEDLNQTLNDSPAFWGAFEAVHYSQDLGIKKPYPQTFIHVCELHNLIPEETIFLDDSRQHVEGAAKAGLQSYFLDLKKEDFAGWIKKMGLLD